MVDCCLNRNIDSVAADPDGGSRLPDVQRTGRPVVFKGLPLNRTASRAIY
jgi:hypothetical protein